MNGLKDDLIRKEELRSAAEGVLVETGALRRCPVHEDVLYTLYDADAEKHAYARATIMQQMGELDGTREEVMDAVAEAIRDAGTDCARCQKD
jgi:predicted component of type VI protein secretion system